MSNQITSYNFHNKAIRTLADENNEVIFCLADVCGALTLTNAAMITKQIQAEFEGAKLNLYPFETAGGVQNLTFITEPQLYFVMMRSRAKVAREFRQWICNEVLPSIRKTGAYAVSTRKIGEKDGVFEDELRELAESSWYAKKICTLLHGKVDASVIKEIVKIPASAWKQGYAKACDRYEEELELAHKRTSFYHNLAEKAGKMVYNVQKNAAKEKQEAEEYRAKLLQTAAEYAELGAEAMKLLASA